MSSFNDDWSAHGNRNTCKVVFLGLWRPKREPSSMLGSKSCCRVRRQPSQLYRRFFCFVFFVASSDLVWMQPEAFTPLGSNHSDNCCSCGGLRLPQLVVYQTFSLHWATQLCLYLAGLTWCAQQTLFFCLTKVLGELFKSEMVKPTHPLPC